MDYKEWFKESDCTRCGECLKMCPEIQLEEEKSKREISNIIEGRIDNIVLKKCSSCFSCDTYCPYDCHPYRLFLSLFNKRYTQEGAPSISRLVFPGEKGNIWSRLTPLLPEDERKMLKAWAKFQASEESMLTGCFTNIFPYLVHSRHLNKISVIGSEHLWCSGGHIYQLGMLDAVGQIGKREEEFLNSLGIKRLITFMDAEYIMLTQILPKLYNLHFNFEVIPLLVWLKEQIQSGNIQLKEDLNLTVTIHDNCFSKAEGEKFFDLSRQIIKETGCRLVEMEHSKEDALCCGFGLGASSTKSREVPLRIVRGAIRRIREAEATGACALITYCSGCLFILSLAKEIIRSKLEIYHIFELVQLSSKEKPLHRHKKRARQVMKVMVSELLVSLFRKNIKLEPISKSLPLNRDSDLFYSP